MVLMEELSLAERHVGLASVFINAGSEKVDSVLSSARFMDYGDRNKATGLRYVHQWDSFAMRDSYMLVDDLTYRVVEYVDKSMAMCLQTHGIDIDCEVKVVPLELEMQAREALDGASRDLAAYLDDLVSRGKVDET